MKLSIAMIVKDEEKNLPRCLDSIKPLLEMGVQLVVVDTGSSDRTMEIAEEYGAELYQHPWERNFAKHRNQSFSYCKRADWIFQLDADETLDLKGRNFALLFDMLTKIPDKFNAAAATMIDWRQGSAHAETHAVRFFRRGKVRYQRRAHNDPVYKGEAVILPSVFMNHYGYDLSAADMKKKAERTISILEEMLAEDPADYDSMFYLAQCYGSWLKDKEKCLEYAILYYEHMEEIQKEDPVSFNTSVFYLIASICFSLKEHQECWKWIEIALKHIPGDLDICHLMLMLGLATKNPQITALGSRGYVNAFDKYEDNRAKKGARFTFHYNTSALAFALYHLTTTYLEQGRANADRMFEILNRPEIEQEYRDDLNKGFADNLAKMGLEYDRSRTVSVDPNKVQSASRIITPERTLNPSAIPKIIRASS